jgi:hypothetical protein
MTGLEKYGSRTIANQSGFGARFNKQLSIIGGYA